MKAPYSLSVVLLFALLGKPVAAAELAPSWTLLPETAALVVRADFTKFLAALREQTKFGAVVLSEDRIRRGLELWQAEQKGEWEQFSKDLGKQGLKPEDVAQLLGKEIGIALTVESREERSALVVGLGWAEPGEELAERLVKAIQGVIEERSGADHPPRRIDLDLAGAEVMHLTFPVMQPEPVDPADFSPDDVDDRTPEKAQKLRDALSEKLKNRKSTEVDRIHLFVARLGGRLLFASTFPQSSAEVTAMDDDAKREIDWDKLTGAEEATGVFARFLAAHAGQGEGELLNTPGIVATLQRAALLVGSSPEEGAVLLEVLGNPQPLLKLAGGDAAKTLEAIGVGTIGPLALRVALNDRALRSGFFISIPEPRQGLLSLLDQPTLPAAPPEWVPSGIVEFQQISFDLGVAFSKIKELAIAQGGDQARQSFVQMETAVQNFVQTDIATLLSALGHQHSMVGFPPKIEAGAADGNNPALPSFNERAGIVWQLKDEAVWQRVMQTLGQFAPAAGGAVKSAEEQGFNGFRLEQGPLEAGLFIGRGYLVLGIGSEVTESLLSVLRNPPTGEAALRTSGLVERAAALMPSPPGLFYQLGDAGANVKTTKRAIEQLIDLPLVRRAQLAQLPGGPGGGEDLAAAQALVAKLKALLPSDDELEGVLGVSVSQAAVSSHGLQLQSAIELPAP